MPGDGRRGTGKAKWVNSNKRYIEVGGEVAGDRRGQASVSAITGAGLHILITDRGVITKRPDLNCKVVHENR